MGRQGTRLERSGLAGAAAGSALLLLLVGCSTEVSVEQVATATTSPSEATEDTGVDPPPVGQAAADEPAATDEDAAGAAPAGDSEPDAAPGDPAPDAPGDEPADGAPVALPARGEPVAVVGVAFDESVAIREDPRPRADVVVRLPPLFDSAVGTGQGRVRDDGTWWRLRVGADEGWAHAALFARLGATTDVTAEVTRALGRTPSAETMRGLGRIVALLRAGDEPDARTVMTSAPRVGDLGDVVYDVVGFGDDALTGERLVVIGTPDDSGEGFVLRSVESTLLCARGVLGDGRCT